jgi:hypothetical protein
MATVSETVAEFFPSAPEYRVGKGLGALKVSDHFSNRLAAAAQNIKRLVRFLSQPTRPVGEATA